MEKVVVVTVTYGKRWEYLSQAIEAVIHDLHLERFLIVDNGSFQKEELAKIKEEHPNKIEIISLPKNIGSAGGFAAGLKRASEIECDYVLTLDDDNVLEPNGLSIFIHNYKSISGRHMIVGFRSDIQSEEIFYTPPSMGDFKYTFFDVWNSNKILQFLKNSYKYTSKPKRMHHVQTKGFVYGGAFLPIDAVKNSPLPDKDLVLYGDDVEYSWGVLSEGYHSYLFDRPIIRDVDMSFEEGDHIFGLFNPTTKAFKVYYRIRNMVRISLRNSEQNAFALHSSIFIWIAALLVLGIFKFGPTRNTFSRMKLILQAVYGGYVRSAKVPTIAHLP